MRDLKCSDFTFTPRAVMKRQLYYKVHGIPHGTFPYAALVARLKLSDWNPNSGNLADEGDIIDERVFAVMSGKELDTYLSNYPGPGDTCE